MRHNPHFGICSSQAQKLAKNKLREQWCLLCFHRKSPSARQVGKPPAQKLCQFGRPPFSTGVGVSNDTPAVLPLTRANTIHNTYLITQFCYASLKDTCRPNAVELWQPPSRPFSARARIKRCHGVPRRHPYLGLMPHDMSVEATRREKHIHQNLCCFDLANFHCHGERGPYGLRLIGFGFACGSPHVHGNHGNRPSSSVAMLKCSVRPLNSTTSSGSAANLVRASFCRKFFFHAGY